LIVKKSRHGQPSYQLLITPTGYLLRFSREAALLAPSGFTHKNGDPGWVAIFMSGF
jgi:hypothetical protein